MQEHLSYDGLIFDSLNAIPHMMRVAECPKGIEADELLMIPGSFEIVASAGSRDKPSGIYVPRRLTSMALRPGSLFAYQKCEYDVAPASGQKLYDHQARSVSFIRGVRPCDGGCLLAADPGTGKTISTLHALWLDGYLHKPGLICAPLPARSSWVGEHADPWKHYGLQVGQVEGTKAIPSLFAASGWWFIHYDIIGYWDWFILEVLKPATIIFDESHYLMNPTSARGLVAYNISASKSVEKRVLLSGSPIPKTRKDLWNQLAIAQPNQWGSSLWKFGVRYCGGQQVQTPGRDNAFWVYNGRTCDEELRRMLTGIYLRYEKDEVLETLPAFTRTIIDANEYGTLNLDEYWRIQTGSTRNFRKQRENEFLSEMVDDSQGRADALKQINKLIFSLEFAKLDIIPSVLEGLLKKHNKIVVFLWQREAANITFDSLRRELKSVKIFISN